MMTPELLLDAKADLGEGPRWLEDEGRLYWVDINARELHRLDPGSGHDEVRTFDEAVGCFGFRQGGGLVLATASGFALVDSFEGAVRPFGAQMLADRPHHRFNDGRVAPDGSFWAGTMNAAKDAPDAGLYRLDPDGTILSVQGGMMTANGAAFSLDGHFHHADTPSHMLRRYDYRDGALSGERTLVRFPHGQGRPDGGSFDEEGFYWSALFDGGRVVRIAPDGEVVQSVPLPVSRPTMIVFGGDDRRTAYVTSARTGLSDEERASQPLAGGLFTFRVDVPGVPEWKFAG
jgi:sugar lactone lactonase YvrE